MTFKTTKIPKRGNAIVLTSKYQIKLPSKTQKLPKQVNLPLRLQIEGEKILLV